MKTKQQKIEAWLIEQGYDPVKHKRSGVGVLWCDRSGFTYLYDETEAKDIISHNEFSQFLGIFKGTEYIKIPDFADDVEEPKDKALQGYVKMLSQYSGNNTCVACFSEINARLLALEAAK